jgi:hypothetical protein
MNVGCQSTEIEVTVVVEEAFDLVLEVGQGPSGPPGSGGSSAFRFIQASPLDTWIINHNLGIEPQVEVMSPGSIRVNAEVVHVSLNQARVLFATPYAGFALLRP